MKRKQDWQATRKERIHERDGSGNLTVPGRIMDFDIVIVVKLYDRMDVTPITPPFAGYHPFAK